MDKMLHLTLYLPLRVTFFLRAFPATLQMQVSARNVAFGSTERLVECGEAHSRLRSRRV